MLIPETSFKLNARFTHGAPVGYHHALARALYSFAEAAVGRLKIVNDSMLATFQVLTRPLCSNAATHGSEPLCTNGLASNTFFMREIRKSACFSDIILGYVIRKLLLPDK